MAQPPRQTIREVLLSEVIAQTPRKPGMQNLQQGSVLDAAAQKLNAKFNPDLEEAILTAWGDLFRTGLLAWGLNLANPNPPFFHLTDQGREALRNLTRDPSNPEGYLRHLASMATVEPIAMSYLTEGLECYVAGLFKASAVMVGAASEAMILGLRDRTVEKLRSLGKRVPKSIEDWRIKIVSDALRGLFEQNAGAFDRQLRDSFEAYWPAFAQQIRATRNDAGHPTSVDPVTPDSVHASLLIFPELAKITNGLAQWVDENLT